MKTAVRLTIALGVGLLLTACDKTPKNTAPAVATPPPPAPLPAMPIEVTFRKALLGNGEVAQFHNGTAIIHAVNVKFIRPGVPPLGKSLVINPGNIAEIGHAEGWSVAPGDVVELSASGYQPSKTTAQ